MASSQNNSNSNAFRRSTHLIIPDDDYYAAQQLEESYRQDFLQRQRNGSDRRGGGGQVPSASAPPEDMAWPPPLVSTTAATTTTATNITNTLPINDHLHGRIDMSLSDEAEQFEVIWNHQDHYEDPDEIFARRLQEQIEREDRIIQEARASSRFTSTGSDTPSNHNSNFSNSNMNMDPNLNSSRHRRQYEITPVWNVVPPSRSEMAVGTTTSTAAEDARLAQQLQDEELARSIAAGMANARKSNKQGRSARLSRPSTKTAAPLTRPRTSVTATTASTTASSFTPYVNSNIIVGNNVPLCDPNDQCPAFTNSTYSNSSEEDLFLQSNINSNRNIIDPDAYNLRIAQEMQDAEMAQRLALFEEEAQRRREQEAAQSNRGRRSRLVVGRILPLLCCGVAVAVSLLFVLGVFDPNNVPFVGDVFNTNNDDYVDPFAGNGGIFGKGGANGSVPTIDRQEQMGWPNNRQSGLSLQILNALEDKWQTYFATAIANWDAGSPIDSLTLTTVRIAYEVECTAVTGSMKVCNGDYGDTKWRGLNEVLVNDQSNAIVSSSAKMNEYYLRNEGADQMLYTMCHEVGHGFGLPHWDEDFNNKDLGNCMDYTMNPGQNDHPDATNFEFLAQIYGGLNVSSGEMVTAEEVIASMQAQGGRRLVGDHDIASTASSTSTGRNEGNALRGLSYWMNVASGDEEPLVSKVRLTNTLPLHLQRRILQANEHFEVHRLERRQRRLGGGSDQGLKGEDSLVTLQFYLLADL